MSQAGGLLVFAALVLPVPAAAQETAGQRANRWIKEADNAFAAGPSGYDAARKAYEAVIALGNTYPRPMACARLAAIERLEGAPALGFELLAKARSYLQPMPRSIGYVRYMERVVLHESASCCIAMGLPDLAAGHARELLAVSRDDPRWRLRATLLDLDVCLGRGDWNATKSRARKARRDAEMLAASSGAAAEIELRELMARREAPGEHDDLAALADRLAELARAEELDYRRQFRALTIAIDVWLQIGRHERALATLRDESLVEGVGADRRAELLALRARAELAADVTFDERADLAAAVAERLAAWRAAPVRPGGSGPLHFEANRASLTTLSVLAGANETAEECRFAYDTLESALALGTISRRLGAEPARVDAAVQLAPRGGGILMFVFGPHLGSILTIDRVDGVTHHTVRLDRDLWRRARAYRKAIEQPPGAGGKSAEAVRALRQRGAAIAARMLPPSARAAIADWRSVLLVGPEPTARLLHALPYGEGWFCTQKAVAHVPSVALGLQLENRTAARLAAVADEEPRQLDLVVLGDPNVDAASSSRWFVDTLALNDSRRAQFTAGFARDRVRARWGDAARAAELTTPQLRTAGALVLFTHGVRDYGRERSAGLLLAADEAGHARAWFAGEIEQLRVPPFVLLGVCGASAGPLRMGDDGSHHLGGAFLLAGAERVALGHGELSVGATRDLLCAALSHWRAGRNAAEALRLARCEIAGGAGRAHPYFFAGLRLLGLPD